MHMRLGLGNGVVAEVEDGGGQHSAGTPVAHAFDQVVERADPARGDHRESDGAVSIRLPDSGLELRADAPDLD